MSQACMKIKWNAQFLKDVRRAPAGCQDVATRNGIHYAKFWEQLSPSRALICNGCHERMSRAPKARAVNHQWCQPDDQWQGNQGVRPVGGDNLNFYVKEGDFGASPTIEGAPAQVVTPKPGCLPRTERLRSAPERRQTSWRRGPGGGSALAPKRGSAGFWQGPFFYLNRHRSVNNVDAMLAISGAIQSRHAGPSRVWAPSGTCLFISLKLS